MNSLVQGEQAALEIEEAIREVCTMYKQPAGSHQQSDHGRKMESVCDKLGANIRRTDQILSFMLQNKALILKELDGIKHDHPTVYEWTKRLTDVLRTKPTASYKCFIDALNKTGQQHLTCLLEDEGNSC